jgi:hypothetical protein
MKHKKKKKTKKTQVLPRFFISTKSVYRKEKTPVGGMRQMESRRRGVKK